MAISDDWTFDFLNKRVYYSTDNTHVYHINVLYSYGQNLFDELDQMDDPIPMEAQTPLDYTMENSWFIDPESVKFLYGGALSSVDYNTNIRILRFQASGYADATAGDEGAVVTGGTSGDTGKLLYYDNALRKWWVRPDDPSTDLFDVIETVTIASSPGTGTTVQASKTGEMLYSNIYSLGAVANDPYAHLYIDQKRETIERWWDRGHIDVLIKCKEADEFIDGGNINVFGHHLGDLFTNFALDISPGGRSAVPLGSGSDLDNPTEEVYLLVDATTAGFTAGEIATGGTSGATAEVVDWTYFGDSAGLLELGNVIGTFLNNEAITDTGGGAAVVNGTIGEEYLAYTGKIGGPFTPGNDATGASYGYQATIRAEHISGVGTGFLVLENPTGAFEASENIYESDGTTYATVSGDPSIAVKAYEDFDPVLIRFVNGVLPYINLSGSFAEGATITGATSGATGVVLADSGSQSSLGNVVGVFEDGEVISSGGNDATVQSYHGLQIANTINRNFQQQSSYPYSVIIDGGGRFVADIYEYLKLFCSEGSLRDAYTHISRRRVLKFSPTGYVPAQPGDIDGTVVGASTGDLGTLVSYDNINRLWTVLQKEYTDYFDEAEAISMPDATGAGTTLGCSYIDPLDGEHYIQAYAGYTPKTTAPFATFAGGKIYGAQGVWFGNVHANDSQNISTIEHAGAIADPPNFQSFLVTDLVQTDRISIFKSAGSGSVVVDKSQYTSDATANDLDGTTYTIQETIPQDTPQSGIIRLVVRDAGGYITGGERLKYTSWSGSVFTLDWPDYKLGYNYDSNDTAYVPYIDTTCAIGLTQVSETVIYTGSTRYIVLRVRRYGIKPWQTAGQFGATGFSIAASRTPDTIVGLQ